jgi:hypothetical protein
VYGIHSLRNFKPLQYLLLLSGVIFNLHLTYLTNTKLSIGALDVMDYLRVQPNLHSAYFFLDCH